MFICVYFATLNTFTVPWGATASHSSHWMRTLFTVGQSLDHLRGQTTSYNEIVRGDNGQSRVFNVFGICRQNIKLKLPEENSIIKHGTRCSCCKAEQKH